MPVAALVLSLLLPVVLLAWGVLAFALRCPRLEPGPPGAATPGGGAPDPSIPDPSIPDPSIPDLSIIVPARDEEASIGACVRSLLAQRGVRFEVIAVDDGSRDATPRILGEIAVRDDRLRVLSGRPLEPGWLGKPNAVDHAVGHARGRHLLFADADTELHPAAAATALRELERRRATFLTLWPRQRAVGVWERLCQPPVIALFLFANSAQRIGGPPHPEALMAWGVFILVDAARYRALGGHAHPSVRGEIGEDYRLFERFRDAGDRPLAFAGGALVAVRMYRSLAALWEGWTKNMFPGLERSLPLTVGAALLVLGATWAPWLLLALALAEPSALRWGAAALALTVLAAAAAGVARQVEGRAWSALTPVGGAVAAAIFAVSAWLHLSGRGVTWKGRRYGNSNEGPSGGPSGGS